MGMACQKGGRSNTNLGLVWTACLKTQTPTLNITRALQQHTQTRTCTPHIYVYTAQP